MLANLMADCKNWFVRETHTGEFTVEGGILALPSLKYGQYFRVIGSTFNDGVHQYPAMLQDETFRGAVWALAVPKDFLELAEKVTEWEKKNGSVAAGPYQSESFGGYSYSKATGKDGGVLTYRDAFAGDLRKWRKL